MNKKRKYNVAVINKLIEKYKVSYRFVTYSIAGEKNSERAIKIAEDYKIMVRELDKILSEL